MTEPRKATDVLLDIESKINSLLDLVRSQDLVVKVLSNKLNELTGRLDKAQQAQPKFTVEAIQQPVISPQFPPGFTQLPAGDPERTIPIVAESRLPDTDVPHGFRRNSRPESYAGDNAYLPGSASAEKKMPVQIPKMPPARKDPNAPPPGRGPGDDVTAMVPPEAFANPRNNKKGVFAPPNPQGSPLAQQPQQNPHVAVEQQAETAQGQIPVMQRCVDKNSKAIFLADVEITDLSNSQPVSKTRTNGAGRWAAPLGVGAYRIVITKRAAQNKEKLEAVQDIQVDGSKSPLELPMVIIKEKA